MPCAIESFVGDGSKLTVSPRECATCVVTGQAVNGGCNELIVVARLLVADSTDVVVEQSFMPKCSKQCHSTMQACCLALWLKMS